MRTIQKILCVTLLLVISPAYYAFHAEVDDFENVDLSRVTTIVWDLGSTLTCVKNMSVAYELGVRHIVSMLWHLGRPSKIRKCMFEVLEKYAGKQQAANEADLLTYDDTGTPLPHFMSDTWFCSRVSDEELRTHIQQAVKAWHPTETKCKDIVKKKELIKKTLLTALSARVLGKHIVYVKKMLELVQLCAQKGYKQYIFSNIDKECFEKAYSNTYNKELFNYFPRENILISGECQMIKPHRMMYDHFLKQYNLDPAHCLLIDDRPENITIAQALGMQTLLVADGKYRKFARKFRRSLTV